jgi:hypothetical protein
VSLDNMHIKIKKIFNNPNINFFIIMCLILLISCYTVINTSLRFAISSFISNPVIILFGLIIVILIGFYNINIAILFLLLLFIMLFGTNIITKISNNKSIENFTDDTNNDDMDDDDDMNDNDNSDNNDNTNNSNNITYKEINNNLIKKQNEDETDEKISNIKNVILGSINKYKENSDNEYKKGLLENKKIILNNEKNFNNNLNKSNNNSSKSNNKSKANSNSFSKENFKTVETRKFDPSSEEDTNLLITKEILNDMINRTEYNYESTKYLKKYLKHRIEEIVEMNKLLEDDE